MVAIESVQPLLGLRARRVPLRSGSVVFVDEGSGPAVLLLHGAPFTSLGFVRVIEGLRARHRVVAPDLPGFGRSRAAPEFDGSLDAYTTSIQELCEALDLRDVYLYGCDSSGCTGLAAAARMPDRIAGVVVADTVPIPMTGAAWIVKMALRHVVTSSLRLADKPTLLLFGRLDPVRLFGAVSRFRRMSRRAGVAIIPRERHFPLLAAGAEVAAAIATFVDALASRAATSAHGLDR